jgi:hypothetical protein
MAGEIERLLTEYGKTLSPINAHFISGKPTEKSEIYTAVDKLDAVKILQNINPNVALKAALLEKYFLPMEKVDYITEFIYKLQIEADQLIQQLTNITLNYTVEFIEIMKDITAIMESITRNLLSLTNMILYLNTLLAYQITYLTVVDIFQTMLNLALMFVWTVYASLFAIPDENSPPDQRAPENGTFIYAVLIPWQIIILILYLSYILIMISLYVSNHAVSVELVMAQSTAIIARRAADVVILFDRALEQVTGFNGSLILTLSVIDSKAKGTAVLTSQLVNTLPI